MRSCFLEEQNDHEGMIGTMNDDLDDDDSDDEEDQGHWLRRPCPDRRGEKRRCALAAEEPAAAVDKSPSMTV